MSNFESVRKFMKTFGQEIKEKAQFPDKKIITLRHELIKEELDELTKQINDKETEYTTLESMDIKDMWIQELDLLKEECKRII